MKQHGHLQGFFETLGALAGSRQRENQLSRTFKACFDHSHVFRTRVLALLGRTCDLKLAPQAASCSARLASPDSSSKARWSPCSPWRS